MSSSPYKVGFFITVAVLGLVVITASVVAVKLQPSLEVCKDIYNYSRNMFKRQLQKSCTAPCLSEDLGVIPFTQGVSTQESLAQLYHYLDILSINGPLHSDLVLELELWFSRNKTSDPPSCQVCYPKADPSIRYILWRGTGTRAEVEVDLTFDQVDGVHRGFWELYQELWPRLEPYATDEGKRKIYLFGHSLGGALVNLCTKNLSNVEGYASGAPRVFSPERANYIMEIQRNLYSIVNDADIITTVPWAVADIDETYHYKALTHNQYHFNHVGKTLADCHMSPTYAKAILNTSLTRRIFYFEPSES